MLKPVIAKNLKSYALCQDSAYKIPAECLSDSHRQLKLSGERCVNCKCLEEIDWTGADVHRNTIIVWNMGSFF